MAHGEVTRQIIGAFYEVYNELGYGFPEATYGAAMAIAMKDRGLEFLREQPLVVRYKGHVVGDYRADYIVEGKIIVELKAVEALAAAHDSQVLSYLRASGLTVGLVLNFGAKAGVRRVIWTGSRLVSEAP
ncbi:GxxExxY protein [Gemmatimonas groenlandica]|uniref:GxxExxY protein n=1 Tax=Gemmatimonas groenlandica TaxID=2732249 RepID=A0A6M4IXF1_9BACT|nr:GxxExxY protein [Gemmatimonas groenlandica]